MTPGDKGFRQRLISGERLIGSFLKTPTAHGAEIIGGLGYDFVVIDQEHGTFDRSTTDNAILAARSVGAAPLVRVATPESILSCLDCGAVGVLAPHVASASYAREVAAACRYREGKRGFATSTRAGGYAAAPMWRHIAESDAAITVIAQIEDPEALNEIEEIASSQGVDALFVGRADLSAAYGEESAEQPKLLGAIERICAAGRKAGKAVCFYIGEPDEAESLMKLGASIFVLSSDQGFLRRAAAKELDSVRKVVHSP